MPRLIASFLCCPDGQIYPTELPEGADCPPELEASARALGLLESDHERTARLTAEALDKAEAEALAKAEAEALAKAEAEALAKAKADADAKSKADADAKTKAKAKESP